MAQRNPGADALALSTSRYQRAYELHLEEMRRLKPSELLGINLDIPTATTLVQSRLRAIRGLREAIVAELPRYDIARFDALETVARAASYAQARYMITAMPTAPLPALSEAAVGLRDQLTADVGVLARRGLVDPARISELRGPVGYKNVAYDLMALASLMRESWDRVAGKTAVEPADIDRAEEIADEMLTAVATREEKPAEVAEAALDRQRAYTLFVRTYDHVRRAITYLRWEERDASRIAPSLYAGRSNGRRREVEAEPVSETGEATEEGETSASSAVAEPTSVDSVEASSPAGDDADEA
jgi:hypothetical protein